MESERCKYGRAARPARRLDLDRMGLNRVLASRQACMPASLHLAPALLEALSSRNSVAQSTGWLNRVEQQQMQYQWRPVHMLPARSSKGGRRRNARLHTFYKVRIGLPGQATMEKNIQCWYNAGTMHQHEGAAAREQGMSGSSSGSLHLLVWRVLSGCGGRRGGRRPGRLAPEVDALQHTGTARHQGRTG